MAITTMAHTAPPRVTVGVDTHKDRHVAAARDQLGRRLATTTTGATSVGYAELLGWALELGEVTAWGVEGTGSYGAGLLTGPAALGLPGVAPLRPHGLTQAVRGRRLGRVRRVPTQPTLQLSDSRLEPGIGRFQLADRSPQHAIGRAQLDDDRGLDHDDRFQIRIGGRDRGLQDTTTSGHARLPMGRTAQLHQQPPRGQPGRGAATGS
jgi:hypothetical protein